MSWEGALIQIINVFLLITVVLVLSFIIAKHAKTRGHERKGVLFWVFISVIFFPVGTIIYLLFGEHKNNQLKNGDKQMGPNSIVKIIKV